MSLVKSNGLQVGQSVTATNNFTMYQPSSPDGTVRWGVGNSGSVTDIVTLNSSGYVGIGTSSPSKKFVVSDAGAQGIELSPQESGTSRLFSYNRSTLAYTPLRIQAQQLYFDTGTAVEAMRLDSSGNLGLGVTPSAWSLGKAFEIGFAGDALWTTAANDVVFTSNAYYNAGWKYGGNSYATRYDNGGGAGKHIWYIAPSGTAGNAITFTQAMTLDASGNLGLGNTNPQLRLDVSGSAYFRSGSRVYLESADTTNSGYWYNPGSGSNLGQVAWVQSGVGERMRIDSSGNVGIGTSSPSSYITGLAVNPTTNGSAIAAGNGAWISGFSSDAAFANASLSSGGVWYAKSAGAGIMYASSSGYLGFYTNSGLTAGNSFSATERMRIDSSGNLKFDSGYGSVATAYGCRAWVNFNGTGTVAIRASGNVSSITDNGTGQYTVNFSTAMPDANYSITGFCSSEATGNAGFVVSARSNATVSTSARAIETTYQTTDYDVPYVNVAFFR